MNILRVACLWVCVLSGVVASAEDVWRSVPTVPRGPRDPDCVGAVVDAVAIRGGKETKARVAIYGARESAILNIAIWIRGLDGIREEELEPYMVMNFGREALNSRMMEITLASPTGEVQFSSRLVVLPDGNFPKGVDDDGYDVLAADCKNDKRFMALIDKMMEGFDQGVVWIGRGVLSPPIEVKFGGKGIQGPLKKVLDFVRQSRTTASS